MTNPNAEPVSEWRREGALQRVVGAVGHVAEMLLTHHSAAAMEEVANASPERRYFPDADGVRPEHVYDTAVLAGTNQTWRG